MDLVHPDYVDATVPAFQPSKAQLKELEKWLRSYMAGPPARKASYEELWKLAQARFPYVFTDQHLLDVCVKLDKEWAAAKATKTPVLGLAEAIK